MNDSLRHQRAESRIFRNSLNSQSSTGRRDYVSEIDRINNNINGLPFEILFFIFQSTIDIESADMKRSFPSYPSEYFPMAAPADRLVSVCRYWKAIVYDGSPSSNFLQSVFWLDFRKPWKQIHEEMECILPSDVVTRSKGLEPNPTPLDLFVAHIGAPFSLEYDWRKQFNVANTLRSFTGPLGSTHILRSLSLHCSKIIRYVPISLWDSEFLIHLQHFHFEWHGSHTPVWFRLGKLISCMPQLEVLKLICQEPTGGIEERKYEGYSLGRLRWLELSASDEVLCSNFMTLLRRTPNIEYLRLCGRIGMGSRTYRHPPNDVLVFPHLRKIHLHNRRFLPYCFVQGWAQTPSLSELVVECTNRPKMMIIWGWKSFFVSNPTITTLSFPVKPGYTVFLSEAPSLRILTLDATRSTGEAWLRRLGDRDTKSLVSDKKLPICPNLKTLTITLGSVIPSTPIFETFIHSRCIPIDEEWSTVTGQKALEQLILRFTGRNTSRFDSIAATIGDVLWSSVQTDQIEKGDEVELRLNWSYPKPDRST